MDIQRSPDVVKKKKVKRIIFSVLALLVAAFVTVVLAKLKPAAPTVERATVWHDTVKRGEMLRQVRGPGTLVPEDIRWVTSTTDATVDRVVTLPSASILSPDTVILELRDSKVQQAQVDAELDLRAAQADLESLKVRLNNELLQQQSDTANIQAQYHKAKIQAEANESLLKDGLISSVTTRISQVEATELENRNKIEQEKLKIKASSIAAQINAEDARVAQKQAHLQPPAHRGGSAESARRNRRRPPGGPGTGRPAGPGGHQPRPCGRPRPPQGGTANSGNAGA